MDLKDYRIWAAIAVAALLLAGGAFFFKGRSPDYDVPIGTGAELPPITTQYLDFQQKENELLDLIQKNPGNAALVSQLGDLYFENENFQQASIEYEKVLQLKPNDTDTLNDLGLTYHYTGRTEQAIETLKKGTALDPSFQRIWLSLGFVLLSSGDPVAAEGPLKKAIDLDPANNVGLEAQRLLGLSNQPSVP